jgi:hypothetical protein
MPSAFGGIAGRWAIDSAEGGRGRSIRVIGKKFPLMTSKIVTTLIPSRKIALNKRLNPLARKIS